VVGDPSGKEVQKVDSTDEGMLIPIAKLARIDFVSPGPFVSREASSWRSE
jgi:hypothetical protein